MVIILKKIILFLFIISILIIISNKEEKYIIPDNAIRFRILANSNSIEDQLEKNNIKNEIKNKVFSNISSLSYEDTNKEIESSIPKIENIIKKYTDNYDINYGTNYFPKKEYKGVLYPEGLYQSLVIKIGDGIGDNWWCVLYPPLCLIDEDNEKVNYDLYLKKIF